MAIYDCTQPFEVGMPVFPGDDPVQVEQVSTVPEDGTRVHRISSFTHAGTHVDAPAHFVADGPTIDEFDVSAFRFDARVVDCTPCADRQRLTTDLLPEDAAETDMLLFRTDWSDHWGTDRYRDSPYLAPDLAQWCGRHGMAVGLEAFGPDPVPSTDPTRAAGDEPDGHPAHMSLCGNDCLIVENLRGLARLPERVELTAYPLAITGGDGSPARAVATVE